MHQGQRVCSLALELIPFRLWIACDLLATTRRPKGLAQPLSCAGSSGDLLSELVRSVLKSCLGFLMESENLPGPLIAFLQILRASVGRPTLRVRETVLAHAQVRDSRSLKPQSTSGSDVRFHDERNEGRCCSHC
jgi:hypothetical protein